MLRIITQRADARTELRRICDRTHDDQVVHKEATVREVLQAVKRQGDRAVLHYTTEFDRLTLKPEELRVSGSELDAAYQQVSKELLMRFAMPVGKLKPFIVSACRKAGCSLQKMRLCWVNAIRQLIGQGYTFQVDKRRIPARC
jgi:histidinol dehydrogenase